MSKKEMVEDKTRYFVEAIVYILCIVVVVFANCFGPTYIKMIPLLFLLGIVGKIIFDRPLITTIFGFCIAICMLKISGISELLLIVILSLFMAIYIALGEICGKYLKDSFKYLKSKKKKKTKEAIISYVLVVVTCLLALLLNNIANSNLFTYFANEEKLNKYIVSNYGEDKFEYVSSNYNMFKDRSFSFIMKNNEDGNNYNFTVYLNKELDIQDGYKEYLNAKGEIELEEDFIKFLESKEFKIDNIEISINSAFNDEFELEISKQIENIDDNEIINYSKEVVKYIEKLEEYPKNNNITQLSLKLKSTKDSKQNLESNVYLEGYRKNKELNVEEDYKYIQRALKIEYID